MKRQIIAALLLTYGMHALATINFIEQLPDKSLIKQLYKQKTSPDLVEKVNLGINQMADLIKSVKNQEALPPTWDSQEQKYNIIHSNLRSNIRHITLQNSSPEISIEEGNKRVRAEVAYIAGTLMKHDLDEDKKLADQISERIKRKIDEKLS